MFQVQGLESHHSGVCEKPKQLQLLKWQVHKHVSSSFVKRKQQQKQHNQEGVHQQQQVVYDTKTIIEFYIHFQNIYDYFIMSFFDYSLSSFFYDFSQCNKRSSSKLIQLVPIKIQCFHSIIIWHLIIQLHTQVLLFAKYFYKQFQGAD